MKRLGLFLIVSMFSGCGLKAPSVPLQPASSVATSGNSAAKSQGTGLAGVGWSSVRMSLSPDEKGEMWAYWKAGAAGLVDHPTADFIRTAGWDMRLQKYFPLIGSNGGETLKDTGGLDGRAAFATVPDGLGDRGTVSDYQGLSFTADRFEALEAGGLKTEPMPQNPLVNTIGSGIVKSYSPKDGYAVVFSNRLFALRAADGISYFLICFNYYDPANKIFGFDWKKILQ